MKNLFLILTILTISFSCKKQQTTFEPEPEPIKTSKSFQANITFTSDSLCSIQNIIPGYYPSGVTPGGVQSPHTFTVGLDTTPNTYTVARKILSIHGNGPTWTTTLTVNITSNDLNKPFTYYINIGENLRSASGSVKQFRYSKQYTFHEGDNGTINFNTLP